MNWKVAVDYGQRLDKARRSLADWAGMLRQKPPRLERTTNKNMLSLPRPFRIWVLDLFLVVLIVCVFHTILNIDYFVEERERGIQKRKTHSWEIQEKCCLKLRLLPPSLLCPLS